MKKIETFIQIEASTEKVWETLSQLEKYKDWNPFIIESKGQVTKGNVLINTMKNGEQQMTFKPKVTQVEEGKYFEWLGNLFVPGLFDGRHYFKLTAQQDGSTLLEQGEYFTGILASLMLRWIGKNTEQGFQAMNQALKNQVER
ncbi:SRPBCC domain-containing protein [bacterium SCSIO 12741]|nr:SRPBCC domain-containing protein [bacterium SCSIO 12741]